MSRKFKPGDLVELKSGGPVMTIESVNESFERGQYTYSCSWFAGAKNNHRGFSEAALKLADIE